MSQLYNNSKNEFIFGEGGGKGKHLSSFLKNLSLIKDRSSPTPEEANSNIYGSLAYNHTNASSGNLFPKRTPSKRSVSLGHSIPQLSPERGKRSSSGTRKSPKARYADLDDDWDAGFDEVKAPVLSSVPDLSKVPPAPSKPMEYPTQAPGVQPKTAKFEKALLGKDGQINLDELRSLSWNGIPPELRALTWQILLGYIPTNLSRQESTLRRKRQEYRESISVVGVDFDEENTGGGGNTTAEKQLYHQINIDVKRTHPSVKLYGYRATQRSLRKVLYLWAVRHPASGYVQGINDLCTPFFQLFLDNYLQQIKRRNGSNKSSWHIPGYTETCAGLSADPNLHSYSIESFDPSLLPENALETVEADTYWCLSRLLENITDNYIHAQPGIIRQVGDLRNLVQRIDMELLAHFEHEGIEFMQFAFRWMNCLLMRELKLDLIVRMWDTYLSETPLGFNNFHIYVCAAFLCKFSAELKVMEFQDILLFLQNPPTSTWTNKDVELILSEAFIWQSLYKNASAHLR